jgi:hypothetical protein
MSDKEEFETAAWCKEVGISESGAKKLLAAEVRDDLAITLLETEDVAAIKLAPGDLAKFRYGQAILRKTFEKPPPLVPNSGSLPSSQTLKPNAEGLYTLAQFSAFLAAAEPPISKPAQPLIGAQPTPSSRTRPGPAGEPRRNPEEANDHPDNVEFGRHLLKDLLAVDDCYSNAAGEKPLLPVNFIRNPKGTITDTDDQVVTEEGKLVVKPNVKKPTADQLTAGQWVAANAVILAKLMPKFTRQDLCDYLDYERRLGGLMQLFTHATVFVLDNEHRIDIHTHGGRWNDIDPLMVGSLLTKKNEAQMPPNVHTVARRDRPNTSSTSSTSRQGQSQGDGRKNAACWQYNSPEGCPYGQACRYGHFDAPGSKPSRPQYERAPRFQNGPPSSGPAP